MTSELKKFQDYCWTFYAPGELSGNIFENKLTRPELDAACALVASQESFEGDSFDREKARDLILKAKGHKTEHFG